MLRLCFCSEQVEYYDACVPEHIGTITALWALDKQMDSKVAYTLGVSGLDFNGRKVLDLAIPLIVHLEVVFIADRSMVSLGKAPYTYCLALHLEIEC